MAKHIPTPSPSAKAERLADMVAELEAAGDPGAPADVRRAVALARLLQQRGTELQSPEERRQQREFERMMSSATDKVTLTQMTDQAFRSSTARRAADQLTHILDVQGIPRFFSVLDRAMLRGFQSFGNYLPKVAMPRVREKMREETANVILPAERELLSPYLAERNEHGLRMNVNFLGEALLGEEDARRRLKNYLAALQIPEIEVMSVKISTIYSQISSIGRDRAIKELCDRMELLYRASAKARFKRADGTEVPKFVYLDMEEYRDLSITVDVFTRTLDRPGLEHVSAGIALQAYIPDSFAAQRHITEWAKQRVAAGGAPVVIRLVKGANMEMERVEASLAGWPQAPFKVKAETDANYKRMLRYGLEADAIEAVRLGVASHNLFDVAYALVLVHDRGLADNVQFEMLEGMANHQRRALHELVHNVLLYAPATKREEFVNAIGYLMRRLDENTGPDNFLRHAFKLEVGSDEWQQLERDFMRSFELIDELPDSSRRTQDRRVPPAAPLGPMTLAEFRNEPDTDFTLEHNFEWAKQIRDDWKQRVGDAATEIPLVIAGAEITDDRAIRECRDPSRPGVVGGRYRQANADDIDAAIACARRDPSGWRQLDEKTRGDILANVAHQLRVHRGDLMGAAMLDGGKIFTQSDPEVSEAIDFVEMYAASAREFRARADVEVSPRGVVAVVPPWNFPIAIPCGGVASALAAGNTVILKPASHTVLVAYELCKCFWAGGVPTEALQFAPCAGAREGARLAASPDVDAVILTGGTSTALTMLEARPEMNLLAETGGKNATIVTAMSDREQAIAHALYSAFGHTGQKCSATSLLILEGEVYDDPAFKRTLIDAAESMKVGSAWDFDTKIGPMINPPGGDLEVALKELEDGESWALMPEMIDDNPNLYSPGIKWGTSPGSYTHMTEFFGPVLAVLRADNLEQAIELTNQTGYGLTSGLESLDDREQDAWIDGIRAGNLYVNRVTTGAIVMRQPFGGMGKSAFGPGIKAGGPNYVAQLMRFADRDAEHTRGRIEQPELVELHAQLTALVDGGGVGDSVRGVATAELHRVLGAMASYADAYRREFGAEHDHVHLVGQDNVRRYLPVQAYRVRVDPRDSAFDIFARVCAAKTVGCHITVSSPPDFDSAALTLLDELTEPWGGAIEFVSESDATLAEVIAAKQTDRVRYAAEDRAPVSVLSSVGETGVYVARAPVLACGRVELLWYVMEQSVSVNYHRYGNLGARSDEQRRPVP